MKFPLDGTGSASSNRVLGETIEIVNGNAQYNNLVFLSAAPFYSENFVLTLTDAGGAVRTLTLGKDYRFFLKLRRTDEVANNTIYGALKLMSNNLTGTLTASYQSLGGEMVINQGQVIAYLGSNVFNNNIAFEALVPYPAVRIPSSASFDWPMDSMANISQALAAKGFISWGSAYMPLAPADAIYNSDGLQETGTGEPVKPGLGGTVKVEGGNTVPVNVTGTVAATLPVEQFSELAKNEAIERLITTVRDSRATISLDNASIQIDNAAKETGGNLEKLTASAGVVTDTAYTGSGSGTLISVMKGLYAKLTGVLNIRQLSANTDTVTTVPSGTQNVSLVNTPVVYVDNLPATQQVAGQVQVSNLASLAQDETVRLIVAALGTPLSTRPMTSTTDTVKVEGGNAQALKVDASATTQPVSVATLPLPTNAAQETGGNLEALKGNVGTTTDAAWEGVVTQPATLVSLLKGVFARLGGVLNIRTLSSTTDSVKIQGGNTTGVLIAGGNTVPVVVDASGTPQPVLIDTIPLAANAAKENGNLATIAITQGSVNDSAYSGAGATTTIGGLKGLYAALKGTLTIRALTSGTDSVTIQGGNSTAVKTDGSATTQPVSAAALPLPTNAAKETGGNLDALKTATGSVNDPSWDGTAGTQATVTAVLKSLWTRLGGVLNTRQLTSGTDSVTVVPSGTQSVSATALPLPTGAATESGNLATIAQATGAQADTVYAGAGNTTVVGALKGLYAALKGTLNTRTLQSVTDSVTVQGGNTTAVKVDGSATTQPVSGAVTANIGTTNGLALDTSVQTLINVLKTKNDITSSVWVDPTTTPDTYYIRRETIDGNGTIAIAFENLAGGTVTPNVVNLVSSSAMASLSVQTTEYVSTSAGTGYSAGQVLIHSYAIDLGTGTPTMAFSVWFNATLATTLASAPNPSTYTEATASSVSISSSVLPTGAAQESGNLATLTTNTGATNATAYAGSGNTTVIGALKGLYAALTGTLTTRALTSATDTVKVEGGNATAVKTDSSATTQPISASTLPLPSNAAKETGGNLDALNAAHGTSADAAYAGSGNGSLIAVAKGLYAALKGTLNTRALTSGTDSVTTVPSGTQAVSVTSLPLPTGAATETGNLASVATTNATIATTQGAVADAAYAGSGTTTVIGALKGMYAAIKGTLNTRQLTSGTDSVTIVPSGTQAISASALPLPANAATESGNLAVVATAAGTPSSVAYAGSGNTTLIGALKGLYAAITGTLTTRQLTAATDTVAVQGGNTTAVKVDGSGVTQPVSGNVTANIGTTNGLALDTSVQTLIDTIKTKGSTTTSVWVDQTVVPEAYYIRRETYDTAGNVVINFETLTGGAATPNTAHLVPTDGDNTLIVKTSHYQALDNIFGEWDANDVLVYVYAMNVRNPAAPTMAYSYWLNATKGTFLSYEPELYSYIEFGAPLPGGGAGSGNGETSVIFSALPLNAAQETGGNLEAMSAALGSSADNAYTGTGASTVISALKAMVASLRGVLNTRQLTSGTDSVTVVPSGTQAVSLASQPLPTGAATESGNLATIATSTGGTMDSPWNGDASPAGPGTVISVLKAVYKALKGTLNTRALTSATDSVTVQGGNTTAVKVDGSGVTQPVSGAVTANIGSTNGLALDSSVQTLINTLKAKNDITSTVWVDPTTTPDTYYIRRETIDGNGAIVIAFETLAGTPVTPNAANLIASSQLSSLSVQSTEYVATAAGTGYASGHVLIHSYAIDIGSGTPTMAFSVWFNATLSTTLASAPASTNYVEATTSSVTVTSSVLPTGAAQESGNLATLATSTGSINAPAYAGAGSTTLVGVLKGIYLALVGTLNTRALTSASDTVKVEGGNVAAVKTDGSGVVQPISAAALPLPTGAATESGNLATIAAAAGTPTDIAYSGSGPGTTISLLKSMYNKLTGTLTIRALTSGTDSVTIQGGNTTAVKVDGSASLQPVSVASLPLPTGAAQEAGGNLAAINTAHGAITDAAYPGAGNGSLVSVAKGIYAALKGTLSIRALASGTDSVTIVPSGTQSVSATSLPLPTGAATESGNLATIATSNSTIATAQGTAASGVTQMTGGVGIQGWLSGIYNRLSNTQPVSLASLPVLPAGTNNIGKVDVNSLPALPAGANAIGTVQVTSLPSLPAGINTIGGVSVVNFPSTQPVSLASQPLPTGAATESGNLATIATAQGVAATGTTMPTGGVGKLGWLSGIYTKLANTLSVSVTSLPSLPAGANTIGKVDVTSLPALPAGGNAIGTVQVSNFPATQAVSLAAVPLPSNAAKEAGGYLEATAVALGSKTDAAWLGSGTSYSSVIGVLKGIFFQLMGTIDTRTLSAATDTVKVEGGNSTAVKVDGSAVTQPVSASALPLPTGAATEATLTSINSTSTALSNALGLPNDAAWNGATNGSAIAVLKSIVQAVAGELNLRSLTSARDEVMAYVPQLPITLGQKTMGQSSAVTIASNQSPLKVESASGMLALDSSIQTLIDTIKTKGSTTSSVWIDKTVVPEAYYVRRETYDSAGNVVIAFESLNGAPASPNISNLVPSDSDDTLSVHTQQYLATAESLAFDQGDVLIYTYAMNTRNPATPTLVYSYWFNATKGVLLASPPDIYSYEMFGNPYLQGGGGGGGEVVVSYSALPTNAAQETGGNLESMNTTLQDANSALVSLNMAVGNLSSTRWYGSDSAPSSVIGVLKAIYAGITGTLNIRALSDATDSVTIQGGNSTAVKVDNSAVTQPISAASLPLPTGAAKETGGNLTSIATNTSNAVTALGSGATGITIPAGGVGVMGWLSGIYNKLSNALTVTVSSLPALPAGANTIGNVGVTSLPALPTGGNTIGAVNAVQSGSWTVSGQASTAAPNLSNGTTNPLSLTTTGGLRVDGSAVIQPVQIQAGSNAIGNVGVTSLPALPAGANAIGSVQVTSLPALPTGSNAIGTVGVSSLPALPAGANSIGSVNAVQSGVWTMSAAVTTAAPTYSTGTNQNLSLNTAGALRVDASGTTQAVSLAALPALAAGSAAIGTVGVTSLPALPAGANTIGNVGVTSLPALPAGGNNIGSVNAVQSGAWSINNSAKVVATPPTYTAGTDQPLTLNTAGYLMVDASDYTVPAQLVAGTASIGTVQAPAITKGNQDANGFSVQQLKDGGRNQTNYFMVKPVVSTATDTLQSLTGYKSAAAVAATTTPAVVTAGKRYRIVNIQITYVGIATLTHVVVTLRANTAGVVALTSPAVEAWTVGTNIATAGSTQMLNIPIPEGMEFAAGTGIGVSVQGYGATGTAAAAGRVSVAIKGFEY